MKDLQRYLRPDNSIDLKLLQAEADWNCLTEFEKVVWEYPYNEVNLDDLLSEVKNTPGLALAKWGNEEDTLLHYAASANAPGLCELLILYGADVNAQAASETPLLMASWGGCRPGIVKLLIESGANINYQKPNGINALHRAAIQVCNEVVHLLLEAGAVPCDEFTMNYISALRGQRR